MGTSVGTHQDSLLMITDCDNGGRIACRAKVRCTVAPVGIDKDQLNHTITNLECVAEFVISALQ